MSAPTTCSAIVSFAEKLEENSSIFYEDLAAKSTKSKEIFLAFSKESRKNRVLITRTYQETITDALEACFIQIDLSKYLAETVLKEGTAYLDALKRAKELEEKASKFYLDAAEQSKSLLATIPKAFEKVAERRNNRKLKIESIIDSLK